VFVHLVTLSYRLRLLPFTMPSTIGGVRVPWHAVTVPVASSPFTVRIVRGSGRVARVTGAVVHDVVRRVVRRVPPYVADRCAL